MPRALDFETRLFGPGNVAPEVICASFAEGNESFVLGNGDPQLWPMVADTLAGVTVTQRGQYDLACARSTKPELTPLIFDALAAGRVHDTLLREKLIQLGTHGDLEFLHGKPLEYNLAALAWKRLGLKLEGKTGEDIWRLRFAELDGRRSSDYPPEAYEYARQDAKVTLEVWEHQQAHQDLLKVEGFHVRAAFCLYLMTQRGLMVDAENKARLEALLDEELDPAKMPDLYRCIDCFEIGSQCPTCKIGGTPRSLLTPACPGRPKRGGGLTQAQPEKVNKSKALQPLIRLACQKDDDRPVKLTDKGQEVLGKKEAHPRDNFPDKFIATDADWLLEISHLHPVLKQYAHRQEYIKLKNEALPNLEWPRGSGIPAEVVHPNNDPLRKTGRSATTGNRKGKPASYPSFHIQGASAVEVGGMTIRDCFKPRPGFVYAVADFTAIDLCSLAQTIKDLFGRSTHLDYLNDGYELHALLGAVLASEEDPEFSAAIADIREDTRACYKAFLARDPAWVKHWRTYAKVFGLSCPGGCGLETLVRIAAGYKLKITKQDAKRLRQRWYQFCPELREYLHGWVEAQGGTYTSPLGMVRAGCSYTELANGRALQTPAAEGFKEALWRVTRACYDPTLGDILLGSYPVVAMHDELVVEVLEDGREAERAERLSELMVAGMKMILPDVPIKAEPMLTRRWSKKAKAVRGADGKLKVWE